MTQSKAEAKLAEVLKREADKTGGPGEGSVYRWSLGWGTP